MFNFSTHKIVYIMKNILQNLINTWYMKFHVFFMYCQLASCMYWYVSINNTYMIHTWNFIYTTNIWYRGKVTYIVCTVENLLASCVPWKTYLHHMYHGKLTDIVCTVENLLSLCVSWKTYWHRVYPGKLTDIMCIVENLLTSCVSWKTYSSNFILI